MTNHGPCFVHRGTVMLEQVWAFLFLKSYIYSMQRYSSTCVHSCLWQQFGVRSIYGCVGQESTYFGHVVYVHLNLLLQRSVFPCVAYHKHIMSSLKNIVLYQHLLYLFLTCRICFLLQTDAIILSVLQMLDTYMSSQLNWTIVQ